MEQVIGWIMIALAIIGGIYCVGLMITYMALPKDANDYDCECDRCNE